MTECVTAFLDGREIAAGERDALTRALVGRHDEAQLSAVRAFDDRTGRPIDLDYRGVVPPAARGAGRPRLGVQAREVTLLPRHWDWLARQPGGASAALRRLVDEARSRPAGARERQDAAYHFMQSLCGDMPGYEEALRALYRSNREDFDAIVAGWPADVVRYVAKLLGPA
ncbi:MAG TPA: DUF2239 family protein [Allosphingosinicella sp.]|jgi:hypothetical protein